MQKASQSKLSIESPITDFVVQDTMEIIGFHKKLCSQVKLLMILSLNGRQKEIFWLFFMPPQKFLILVDFASFRGKPASKNNKMFERNSKAKLTRRITKCMAGKKA